MTIHVLINNVHERNHDKNEYPKKCGAERNIYLRCGAFILLANHLNKLYASRFTKTSFQVFQEVLLVLSSIELNV